MIRVLIVDDAPIIRHSIGVSVERIGNPYMVSDEAFNGVEALEWLELHYADLCITDVKMPVMDGLELIAEIRRRYPWIVCLVISSYDEFEYARASIELEAVDYILKPVNQEQLKHTLVKSAQRIKVTRSKEAMELFVKKLPHHHLMMEKWLEHIRSLQYETIPLLVVDTLELLNQWVGDKYYLLNELSMTWLQTVVEELHKLELGVEFEEGEDTDLGEKKLEADKIRGYFRICAVRRLEEGANSLIQAMRLKRSSRPSRVIEAVIGYINDHCSEKISIQDIANFADISRSNMAQLFKQETGMTFNHYLVSARMKHARDLLLNTSMKSYEIAAQTGYEDVIYFAQLFKKHFGMPPIEYKKRMES